MNGNQPLTELRRLFEQPAGERTVAHECPHPTCETITLDWHCAKHRHPANSYTAAPREPEELRPC